MAAWRKHVKLMTLGFHSGPKYVKYHMLCHLITFIIFMFFWVRWNGGVIPWFLVKKQEIKPAGVSLLEFFPQVQQDASRITWACAANSKDGLKKAIAGSLHVLEGDVVLHGQGTSDQQLVPIMANLPSVTGDLSFSEWINIAKDSGKAIKLDFQSIEAVEITLQTLNKLEKKITSPVWLSGEILPGPNSKTASLDSQRFLRICTQDYPSSTLLLGWRTGMFSPEGENTYDWHMVKAMHDLVEKWSIKQHLVFAVRAAYAKRSMPQLKWLAEMTGASLAVFSDSNDGVAAHDLMNIRQKLHISKVYFDLSDEMQVEFNELKSNPLKWNANGKFSAQNETFHSDEWTVMRTGKKEQVYVGTESVLLQGGLIISKETFTPTESKPVTLTGRVIFLPHSQGGDTTLDSSHRQELGVEIFLRVTQGARPSAISGIKCFVGANGKISASAQSVPGADSHSEMTWTNMPSCVDISIEDNGKSNLILTVLQPTDCYMLNSRVLQKKSVMMHTDKISIESGQIAVRTSDSNGFIAIPVFHVT